MHGPRRGCVALRERAPSIGSHRLLLILKEGIWPPQRPLHSGAGLGWATGRPPCAPMLVQAAPRCTGRLQRASWRAMSCWHAPPVAPLASSLAPSSLQKPCQRQLQQPCPHSWSGRHPRLGRRRLQRRRHAGRLLLSRQPQLRTAAVASHAALLKPQQALGRS